MVARVGVLSETFLWDGGRLHQMLQSGVQDGCGVEILVVGGKRFEGGGLQSVGFGVAKTFVGLKVVLERLDGFIVIFMIDSIHNCRVTGGVL